MYELPPRGGALVLSGGDVRKAPAALRLCHRLAHFSGLDFDGKTLRRLTPLIPLRPQQAQGRITRRSVACPCCLEGVSQAMIEGDPFSKLGALPASGHLPPIKRILVGAVSPVRECGPSERHRRSRAAALGHPRVPRCCLVDTARSRGFRPARAVGGDLPLSSGGSHSSVMNR